MYNKPLPGEVAVEVEEAVDHHQAVEEVEAIPLEVQQRHNKPQ
jgi:hypothetical protein